MSCAEYRSAHERTTAGLGLRGDDCNSTIFWPLTLTKRIVLAGGGQGLGMGGGGGDGGGGGGDGDEGGGGAGDGGGGSADAAQRRVMAPSGADRVCS